MLHDIFAKTQPPPHIKEGLITVHNWFAVNIYKSIVQDSKTVNSGDIIHCLYKYRYKVLCFVHMSLLLRICF